MAGWGVGVCRASGLDGGNMKKMCFNRHRQLERDGWRVGAEKTHEYDEGHEVMRGEESKGQ